MRILANAILLYAKNVVKMVQQIEISFQKTITTIVNEIAVEICECFEIWYNLKIGTFLKFVTFLNLGQFWNLGKFAGTPYTLYP